MIFKDYYKILGFDDCKVSQEEIKSAYREQAKKYHPDVNGVNRNTEERFKDINEAYRTLSNETSRRKYDRAWRINIGRRKNREKYGEKTEKSDSMKDNLFNMFFGNITFKRKENVKQEEAQEIKGEDVETEIKITLAEAFYGKMKKISLRTVKGDLKTITVKIPAGIRNNEKIRLIGQGKKSKKNDKPGDLFIKIKVEQDEDFILKGYDIYTKVYITPWEAALGRKIKVKTIDGIETIEVKRGTSTGEKIVVENKGFRDKSGKRGSLICEVAIMIPFEITEEEEEIYNKLERISNYNPRKSTDKVDIL